MTERYTGVVDRIVDGETAVLLLEDDETETVVAERVLDVDRLPEDGRHEGAVFDVELADDGDRLEAMTHRPAVERERREEAQDRFDRLSERLSDRDEDE